MEAVHDSLGRLDGVHSVSIDLQKNVVTIVPQSDRMLDLVDVADAIRRAGFRPRQMVIRARATVESTTDGRRLRIDGWSESYPWSGETSGLDDVISASVDYLTRPPTLAPHE